MRRDPPANKLDRQEEIIDGDDFFTDGQISHA
jgi:hypothetical protein